MKEVLIIFTMLSTSFVYQKVQADTLWYLKGLKSHRAPTSADCERQGQKMEDRRYVVDKNCMLRLFSLASDDQKFESHDKKLFVMGYKNIIFVVQKKEIKSEKDYKVLHRIISGPKSKVVNIQHVSLSPNGKEISVVDKRERDRIYIFLSQRNGNVVPERVIDHKTTNGAIKSFFHPTKEEELIVLNFEQDSIYVLPRYSDSRSPRKKDKVYVKRTLANEDHILDDIKGLKVKKKKLQFITD